MQNSVKGGGNAFSLAFGGLVGSAIYLVLVYLLPSDHSVHTIGGMVSTWILLAGLLLAPELSGSLTRRGLLTAAVLLFYGLSGWLLPIGLGGGIVVVVGVVGLASVWVIYSRWRGLLSRRSLVNGTVAAIATLLIGLRLWTMNYFEPNLIEGFATATLHLDTFHHGALSESIMSRSVVSTSIHGTPAFRYHFLNHWIFGGMSKLAGVKSLVWYACYYPAVITPLFIVWAVNFMRVVTRYLSFDKLIAGDGAIFLLLYLSLPFVVTSVNQPLTSQSTALSIILLFIHAVYLLDGGRPGGKTRPWVEVTLVSFVLLLAICMSKISTGFVWVGAVLVLCVYRMSWRRSLSAFGLAAVLAVVVLQLVYPVYRLGTTVGTTQRFSNLFNATDGFWYVFLPPLIAAYLNRRTRKVSLRHLYEKALGRSPRATLTVALLATWGIGWFGALVVSGNSADVIYMTLPAFFLSALLAYVILRKQAAGWFATFSTGGWKALLLLLIIGATPTLALGPLGSFRLSVHQSYSRVEKERLAFAAAVLKIAEEAPENAVLYLQQSDALLDGYPGRFPIPALFAVGMTGLPVISGFSEKQWVADLPGYGRAYYKNSGLPLARSLSEAKAQATALGYGVLIVLTPTELGVDSRAYEL